MKRVLIVDDAAFMRAMIKNMLVDYEYEIVGEAVNGAEAVQLFQKLKPDITTMDITMPSMSGIEALKEIKMMDKTAKVVMISAMGQEGLIKEAVLNGASSFIVKPFQKNKLIEVLDGVTNN